MPDPTLKTRFVPTSWDRRMLVYGLLLVLSLGAALAVVLRHDRNVRYHHGQQQVSAIAAGAERELRRELAVVERGLSGFATDAQQLSRAAPERAPELLALRIAGIHARNPDLGNITFGTSLPDQPGMRAVGGNPTLSASRMHIGHPRKIAGAGWILPLALPIHGAVAGEPTWLFASLRISALEEIAAGLALGSDGIVNIVHLDGWMVVRSRDQARWVGRPMHDSALFRRVQPGRLADVFEMSSRIDGTTRVAAYRVLPEYPLLVAVGIARKQVLRGWGTFALTASVLGGLLALLWGALLWVGLRSRAKQRQLVEVLQHSAASLREVRRIASLGDWTWEVDADRVTWSEEIYGMHGLEPQHGSFPLADIPQRIHPDDKERRRSDIARLLASGEAMEINYRIIRADGETRTIFARGEWVDHTPGQRVLRGIQQDITELAEARAQLQVVQDEYKYLFDYNPLPMLVFELETLQFIAVNETAVVKYGYSREEFLARTFMDIRPADEVADVRAYLAGQAPPGAEVRSWRHQLKNGQTIHVNNAMVQIDFHGRRVWLVLVQDVTAQVLAQAERTRSEQRFELVARATSDAVWDLHVGTGELWWSESFYQLFGYSREQIPPHLQAWEDLVHPDDVARVHASFADALEDPAVTEWEEEYRFRRGDGQHAEVIDRGYILRDTQGGALRMVGGIRDLTQKHRDQSDLRLLRRAVESTENGVVISDARLADMPVVYVNAAFERITGYNTDEVIGRNCRFLQGDESEQIGRIEIHRGIAQGHEARALLRNYRKDGELFWNDLRINPVRDDAGIVTHYVGVLNDVTERQRYQEQIAHRANHDELTGLPNRTLLLDRLQQAIAAAARVAGGGVGVAFIDLDNFKLINDGLGHAAGDTVLRAFSARLSACIRGADTVGRFGGDEFVLVISEQPGDGGIGRVIERVEAAFAEPLDIGGAQHYITGSIGYCCYPGDGNDPESLLMRADIAMYEAKQAGRNRVVKYRHEFDAAVSDRLFLVARLREALAHEEFVLHFQPLFRADGIPTGMEALVRWQHPDQGLLPPGRFINACEHSGLIVPLGRWVLQEAARHHALLAAHGLAHLTISINVSALQFQPSLVDDVQAALQGHGLPLGALEVELTESAVMSDPEAAIVIMNRLNALGVSVAVDDFGTGYSSLAYLKRLPIARLKIDQSFVRDLGQDEDDEAICTSIIALAHSLKLGTVAEGVETEDQRRWLLDHGCDELQGYLLGRPVAFDALMARLAAERTGAPDTTD